MVGLLKKNLRTTSQLTIPAINTSPQAKPLPALSVKLSMLDKNRFSCLTSNASCSFYLPLQSQHVPFLYTQEEGYMLLLSGSYLRPVPPLGINRLAYVAHKLSVIFHQIPHLNPVGIIRKTLKDFCSSLSPHLQVISIPIVYRYSVLFLNY